MKLFNYKAIEREGRLRWLVRGPNFDMRLVEIEPRADDPEQQHRPHTHPWEHEVFVIEGNGAVWDGNEKRGVGEGDVIYIPAGEAHTLINSGDTVLRFICCIPAKVNLKQITPVT